MTDTTPLAWLGCGEWGFRELSIPDRVQALAGLGFGVVEFGIGGGLPGRLPEEPTDDDIDTLIELHRDAGLRPEFAVIENDFTLDDPAEHRTQVDRAIRLMGPAKACGAHTLRLFTGFAPLAAMTHRTWAQLIAGLEESQAAADEHGLRIALETHHGLQPREGLPDRHVHTATTHVDGVARLLAEMPSAIGFLWDPANVKTVPPVDPSYLLDVIGDRVAAVHLKDWRLDGEQWVTTEPGAEDIPYASLLPRLPFDGACLVEYDATADVVEGTRRGVELLRRLGCELASAEPASAEPARRALDQPRSADEASPITSR